MSFWSRITSSSNNKADAKPATQAPIAAAAAAAAAATIVAELDPQRAARLDFVFRHGPRHGVVNPLRFVVQRYRQQQQQEQEHAA